MKKIFLFLIVSFIYVVGYAQKDRFTDYNQLVNKSVVLYDLNTLMLSNGKFIYKQIEGKLKAVSPKDIAGWGDALELNCIELISIKNKQYIHCVNQEQGALFLLINTKKNNYINKFRNITYWNSILDSKKEEYAYLYDSNKSSIRMLDKYLKIYWGFAELPLTNIDADVKFHYTIANSNDAKIVSESDFINNAHNNFRSKNEYEQSVIEQHKLDSIQEIKDRKQDAIALVAECCVDRYDYGSGKHDYMSKGDTIYVYYADNSFMKGWFKYQDLKIPNKNIKPLDYEQYKFIKYRGYNNVNFRDSIAREESDKYSQRVLVRLQKKLKELEAKLEAQQKEIRTKQLFLKDYDYAYGEYSDFGLKFEIHNCWLKTIKYVEFTATAYNAVGDVQSDWLGKSISKTKGIGPLEPGETATWAFDNMFYDKHDVIRKAKLTKITFIFTDGTSKTFTGNSNINKHRW